MEDRKHLHVKNMKFKKKNPLKIELQRLYCSTDIWNIDGTISLLWPLLSFAFDLSRQQTEYHQTVPDLNSVEQIRVFSSFNSLPTCVQFLFSVLMKNVEKYGRN